MALKADFSHFLNENGKVHSLTEQASTVFSFLKKIVSAVTFEIEQPIIEVDLQCGTRASGLNCTGSIEASCPDLTIIHWRCDSCEASGTITNWQGSMWDNRKPTIH